MRCPICGAKIVNNMCQYCKITDTQILNSSNVKAKNKLKNKDKSNVYFTSYLPKDINKVSLYLMTILGGFLGINSFYIGRNIKGSFCLISFLISIIFSSIISYYTFIGETIFLTMFKSFFIGLGAIVLLIWFNDILGLIFRYYKVPVVLGDK